jgi:hypothetical protein
MTVMNERFKPPNNLFLLNPKHEANLPGHNIRIHDRQFLELLIVIIVIAVLFWIPFSQAISRLFALPFDPKNIPGIIAIGFVLFTLILLLCIGIQHQIQNRTLERKGQLLIGYIVKAESKPQKAGYRVEIHYRFQSPDGKALEKREDIARQDIDERSLPSVDTPVAILYVSPKLYRVL